ncbi:MAG: DUF1887 family CARF protein [Bacillota bacterium]|nr:DUF1887 family CARF protein [Bacillota bacterium]
MKTLIEIYDERAIENVIGPETFRPEDVVYLCPAEVAQNRRYQEKLKGFFASRGLDVRLHFAECSMYKADTIYNQFHQIAGKYQDCTVDITGGTDAALFAAGMFCQETGTPVFTYSRKKNRFYDISNASFADDLPCELEYKVEEFFRMAGGQMREGRVDNTLLSGYMDKYEGFFQIFLKRRRRWPDAITFLQRISQVGREEEITLHVCGDYVQKGERGSRIKADESLLNELQQLGFIQNLRIESGKSVEFDFTDLQVRSWLRDVGSVLELYMYKMCVDAGVFHDVVSSAVVDWDGSHQRDSVSNEIDVVASRGVIPVFISCKATEVKTEALNELAILRDRFGGKGAKAVIATTEYCNSATRHRAAQLGITVIDREEMEAGVVPERLRIIIKAGK